jgi:hypothetical protein
MLNARLREGGCPMRDYRTMSPCERVVYYRREIRRLTPPRTQRDRMLIETFQQLLTENETSCPQQSVSERGG